MFFEYYQGNHESLKPLLSQAKVTITMYRKGWHYSEPENPSELLNGYLPSQSPRRVLGNLEEQLAFILNGDTGTQAGWGRFIDGVQKYILEAVEAKMSAQSLEDGLYIDNIDIAFYSNHSLQNIDQSLGQAFRISGILTDVLMQLQDLRLCNLKLVVEDPSDEPQNRCHI